MRLLSLLLLLRRSPAEVIAVTEVIGYRRSHPCKWRRVDNLARSPLTPRFLLLVKLAILLDPLRILVFLGTPRPRDHHQYHPVASKMLKWSSSASSRSRSWFSPPGSPLASSRPVRPERSRPHHSYYDGAQASRGIFSKGPIVLQKDHRGEIVDAEAGEAGQGGGATIPCKVSGAPYHQNRH